MPDTGLTALELAADMLDPPSTPRDRVVLYHDDPAGFVTDCIRWPEGKGPTEYQLANLRALPVKRRVAVRGPHGLGKTGTSAWVILWFALTRDAAGEDWKIPTTASAWRQLEKYLWPEVRKWARLLDWDRIDRDPFTKRELLQLSIKLRFGEAFAVACEDPATIEGAHADQLLYVFDEAKTIPAETFDACEGAFSGAGSDSGAEAWALASSTPGEPQGRFYDIHARKPGLDDWHAVHVTKQDAIDAGRMSEDWARQRARQWGAGSAIYINRVEGNFAASDEDGIIPLAWVEAANERWLALAAAHWPDAPAGQPPTALDHARLGPLTALGADIARSGPDKTVIALRHALIVSELRRYAKQGTMATAGQILGILTGHAQPNRQVDAVIDVIGIGAGVVDRLREQGQNVTAFNAAEGTDMLDRSGELGFVNSRAGAWWNLREMLDPDSGLELALPPDDRLTGDLVAPHWRVMSGGRIQVESKDDIKKRIGRSTDDGDAVVQAFWSERLPTIHAPVFTTKPSRWKLN